MLGARLSRRLCGGSPAAETALLRGRWAFEGPGDGPPADRDLRQGGSSALGSPPREPIGAENACGPRRVALTTPRFVTIHEQRSQEAHFQAEVERHLGRNFFAHVVHGMLGQTGFRIIQAPTFLPAYLYALSGSNTLVGVARACQALGTLLTPVFGATLIEHRRRVRPLVFLTGAAMRLQVLGLALTGYFASAATNIWAVCVLLGLFGVFTGMQAVTFQFLVSKIIPLQRRGALVGMRNALAGVSGIAVSIGGGYFVEHATLGNGYATTFLVSFALTAAGLMVLFWMHEPDSPVVRARSSLRERFGQLPGLMREAPDFKWYVVARGLGISGLMAQPYFVLYAARQLDVSKGLLLALLTPTFMLSQTIANLLWGLIADRRGFRDVLLLALATWIGATLLALWADDLALFIAAFAGLGMAFGGFQLATTSLVLEFGRRQDLPMRIAIAQSGEQLVAVLAPLAGGLIAQHVSYAGLFWASAAAQTLALALTAIKVPEPRRQRAGRV